MKQFAFRISDCEILLALLIWLLSAASASATSRYASPSGGGTACTTFSPCTVSTAISGAVAGDQVILKDGTYTSGSGSVITISDVSGAAGNPIRLTAENPGSAILQGNGASGHVLRLINVSWWDIDNLIVTQTDNSGNTGSNASVIGTFGVSNINFREMVSAGNNTYGNNDAVLLQGTNILFEDSDILRSHRNFLACYPATTSNVTIRRVYIGQTLTDHSGSGPPDGFVFYSCQNSKIENSIAENVAGYGFSGWGDGNANYGSIALSNGAGLFNGAASSITDQGDNFTLKDFVAKDNSGTCMYLRPPHATATNLTCIGDAVGVDSDFIDGGTANFTITNALVKDTAGSGFFLSDAPLAFSTKLLQYSQAWNTGGINGGFTLSNTPPNPPGDVDPNIGACIVNVPGTGAFKGNGLGGADVGANVLYAYVDGVLTNTRLWSASTGKMLFGPPVVAGINDSSTGTVRDTVHTRLNVASPGCLPASYGSTFADNFNRADGGLGANWSSGYTVDHPGQIVGNRYRANETLFTTAAIYTAASFGPAQFMQVDIPTFTTPPSTANVSNAGVLLRAAAAPAKTFYRISAWKNFSATTTIMKYVNGVVDVLAQETATNWSAGDTLYAEIDSNGIIVVKRNGTAILSAINNSIPSGQPGIIVYVESAVADVELDNATGGDL